MVERAQVYDGNQAADQRIERIVREHLVPRGWNPVRGIVLYMDNPPARIITQTGFRVIGRTSAPIDASAQFNIASVTKMIVATLILQLMEQGALRLENLAAEYLDEISFLRFDRLHVLDGRAHAHEITIDHLLQHRSGLGDIFIDTALRFELSVLLHRRRQFSPKRIIERFFAYGLNLRPHFTPGNGFYYSDVNYVLLGLVIEQLTGEPLPRVIRDRILAELGMADTYFEFYEPVRGNGKRLDSYYGPVNMTRFVNQSYEWAGGGLVSTTGDLARFLRALLAGRLFSQETTLPLMIDASANQAEGHAYARGTFCYAMGGDTFFGHGGFYGSLLMGSPKTGILLALHIAQARAPYTVQTLAESILEAARAPSEGLSEPCAGRLQGAQNAG